MASEHLILIVAALIVVNRGFDSTGLKTNVVAFVLTQLFDLAMVIVLFVGRIPELPTKADYTIRLFLMAFVAWHMVRNYQTRTGALRRRLEDERDKERRLREHEAAVEAEGVAEGDQAGEISGTP